MCEGHTALCAPTPFVSLNARTHNTDTRLSLVSITMSRPSSQSSIWAFVLLNKTRQKVLWAGPKFKLWTGSGFLSVSCFSIVSPQGLVVWDCSPWQWGCSGHCCIVLYRLPCVLLTSCHGRPIKGQWRMRETGRVPAERLESIKWAGTTYSLQRVCVCVCVCVCVWGMEISLCIFIWWSLLSYWLSNWITGSF